MRKATSFDRYILGSILVFLLFVLSAICFGNAAVARFLWNHQYRMAAYYINYSDGKLAAQEAQYYFSSEGYELDKAKKAYLLALKLDPSTPLAHYQLARIYFVQGDFKDALQEINTELVTNPQNLRSLYVRALIEMTQGDLPNAESDFARFVAWAPTEWGGYNDLAYVQAKEAKYAASAGTIHEALKNVPNAEQVPWLWNSLGLAQLNQGNNTGAATSFQKALTLANNLTADEWRRAYTANDPAGDTQSIEEFRAAITSNLAAALRQ